MSLMGAAEISFQLPNHGKGRVVLLGCDQLLKSYALFKDDYQGIRVGEKFLREPFITPGLNPRLIPAANAAK